jgi:hypothetical protein
LPKNNPSKVGRPDIQIELGGGENFTLPKNVYSQSKITVRDGEKKFEEFVFKDIPETRQVVHISVHR